MLPFTKRAGRGPAKDEDVDVVTKDDLAKSSTLSSRPLARPPAESISDDDMTNIVSSKAIGHILPAAGRPASNPPPASLRGSGRLPPSVRPPAPPSARPPAPAFSSSSRVRDDDHEDDDGRTAIRGAPRIVKRSSGRALGNGQGQLAPASVIKATLESARANGAANAARREALLASTPSDLLDESDDRLGFTETIRPDRVPFVRSAQPLLETAPPSVTPATGYGPPSSNPAPHASYRPAGLATVPFQGVQVHAQPSNMALAQTAYASQPPTSHPQMMHPMPPVSSRAAFVQQGPFTPRSSPPPASAPAHFMTPQMAGRYADPPGTAVTSGHRVPSGRPAASWAVALLACGLFVGVAAVAVTQGSEGAADTTASFVDPSRTTTKVASGAQAPATQQAAAAAPVQGGVIGASPVQDPALAPTMPGVFGSMPAAAPVAAAPTPSATIASGGVVGGFAPVAVTPAPAPVKEAKAEKEPKPAAPHPVWHAAPRPAPSPKVASNDEPREAKEPPASKKKAGSNAAPDDETKKALEALQKAQLESSNSFGN